MRASWGVEIGGFLQDSGREEGDDEEFFACRDLDWIHHGNGEDDEAHVCEEVHHADVVIQACLEGHKLRVQNDIWSGA